MHRLVRAGPSLLGYSRHIAVGLDQQHILLLPRSNNEACKQASRYQSAPRPSTCSRNFSTAPVKNFAAVSDAPKFMINDLQHQEILVAFADNHTVRYPSFWLRDHCPCAVCTHPHTKQRQIDTFSLSPDIRATEVQSVHSGLQITWPDHHTSTYPWQWLSKHGPISAQPTRSHPRASWEHVSPASPILPSVQYDAIMNEDQALGELLRQIRVFGFSFIDGTPASPEATKALLERIAFIRVTHYGGFWDFTSEVKPIDTAYTNIELPAHTDNTYFTDPCGLQMFHCLKAGQGGESTFVDGFAAAKELYKISHDYYNILASVKIVSHASGDANAGSLMNNAAHPGGFPVLTHAVPHIRPHPRDLTQIRWNNDDRHASTQWPSHERMIMWYRAARAWKELLASKEFEVKVQLEPGRPVIFDNWRILHGRKAFKGQRRICGGYIGMDDFLARERAIRPPEEPRPEVQTNVADKSTQH